MFNIAGDFIARVIASKMYKTSFKFIHFQSALSALRSFLILFPFTIRLNTENLNWLTIEYLHTQMTIILIYVIEETGRGRKMIIEKLKQKIENYINLHKGTLIELHGKKNLSAFAMHTENCTKA